jgi:Na+-transporting methylmalonyl-CoA/oxaloacetate decarboxylase gamma subunit
MAVSQEVKDQEDLNLYLFASGRTVVFNFLSFLCYNMDVIINIREYIVKA